MNCDTDKLMHKIYARLSNFDLILSYIDLCYCFQSIVDMLTLTITLPNFNLLFYFILFSDL